jgi:dipeptidase
MRYHIDLIPDFRSHTTHAAGESIYFVGNEPRHVPEPFTPIIGGASLKTILLSAMVLSLLALAAAPPSLDACTSILVSKGASKDGSVMITYACDGEFHPRLQYHPAADHKPGDVFEIKDWSGTVRGTVMEVPHTYAYVGLMNENQVAIGETTFDGRMELENPEGLLHYWTLMGLALQRSKTAREAINVIGELVEEYGYRSTGESISIADKSEAWLMEIIGPGPGGTGANWVALRIPDGYLSCTANRARIGTFPLNNPDRCLYSKDVIDFAVRKGYYDPASGKPFSFRDAYCPATPQRLRYCETRVWSIFRRAAPSQTFSPDYHRGVEGAEPYPLWIKPDAKLSVHDVMSLMRDHYEGTPFDMTTGVDAGPFCAPDRWRPMTWTVDSVEYSWERPISTQQTGFSFVSQSRSWLPDAIGGVYWYGVDDTYTSCYIPFYACTQELPPAFTTGSLSEFSWDSAWWVFNFVANFANVRYSAMIVDIQAVQQQLEGDLLAFQPVIERTALDLYKSDPALTARYLTDYSLVHAEDVVRKWRTLGEFLITKYNDGYVQESPGRPEETGYSEAWLRNVLKDNPDAFKLKKWKTEHSESDLPF